MYLTHIRRLLLRTSHVADDHFFLKTSLHGLALLASWAGEAFRHAEQAQPPFLLLVDALDLLSDRYTLRPLHLQHTLPSFTRLGSRPRNRRIYKCAPMLIGVVSTGKRVVGRLGFENQGVIFRKLNILRAS